MATMTATNQQYYAGYSVAQGVSMSGATGPTQAYQQHQAYQHNHQQHQVQQQVQQTGYQQQQHHHNTAAVMPQQSLGGMTQLGHQGQQRTVSASTNSSTAAALYNSLEATKSTKGASKLRRDLIKTELEGLGELLPFPASAKLSQLDLMALVLKYVRKSNYFCNGK